MVTQMYIKPTSNLWLIRAVLVLAVLFGMIFTLGAVGVSAGSVDADREINQTEVSPGDSVIVTVDIVASNEDPDVIEEFEGNIENVSIQTTHPETVVEGVRENNTGVGAVWEETDNASITYELVIPTDADEGDTVEITGKAGTSVIEIRAEDEDNDSSGGGGGGGGGGSGGAEDPAASVELFDLEDYTTIRVSDIPQSSELDIDTEHEVVGEPFAISSIWLDFRFDPNDFRIEASDPRADADGAAALPSDAGEPLGYVELDFIGADESTIVDTRVSFSVDAEMIDGEASRDDLVVYQYTAEGWTSLEIELDDGSPTASFQNINDELFAVAIDLSDDTESDETEEPQEETETEEQEGTPQGEQTDTPVFEVRSPSSEYLQMTVAVIVIVLVSLTLWVRRE